MKPSDFKITDISEQTKKYCLDNFDYLDLAEYFYKPFVTNWRDRLEDGRKPKWKSPDLALKKWVREASPRGQMYNAGKWEEALAWCKAKERKQAPKEVIEKISTAFKTTPPPVDMEKQRAKMKKLRLTTGL